MMLPVQVFQALASDMRVDLRGGRVAVALIQFVCLAGLIAMTVIGVAGVMAALSRN